MAAAAPDGAMADGSSGVDRLVALADLVSVASETWGAQALKAWMNGANTSRHRYLVVGYGGGLYDVMVTMFAGGVVGGVVVPQDAFPPLPPGVEALEMRRHDDAAARIVLPRHVLERAASIEVDNTKQIMILAYNKGAFVVVVPRPAE